jgi:hypothetical protein
MFNAGDPLGRYDPPPPNPEDLMHKRLAASHRATGDSLRTLLAADVPPDDLPQSAELIDLRVRLESLTTMLLREKYLDWDRDGLDDILLAQVQRTGIDSVEVLGLALLIEDESIVPIQFELRLEDGDLALICRLGEPGAEGGMKRPRLRTNEMFPRLQWAAGRSASDAWAYEVRLGGE